MFVLTPAWNSAQAGYAAPYWGSSLKGNGSENLDVFKRQRGLQGHHTFLIRLTLLSQFKGTLLLFPSGQKTVKLTCARRLYPMSSIRSFFFSSAFARCGIVVFAAQAVTARPLSRCNISSGSICWNQIYDFSSKRHTNPIGDWGTANHSVKKATGKKITAPWEHVINSWVYKTYLAKPAYTLAHSTSKLLNE